MKNQSNGDLIDRLNDYLLSNKKPMKSKFANDCHLTVRLPKELLETLQDWSYQHNRSLSQTVRGFL